MSERSHVITYKLSVFKPYTNKPTLSMGFYAKNKKPLVEPLRSSVLFCAHRETDLPKKQQSAAMRTAGASADILFSWSDIPDSELISVHGEADLKTGKGEAVDTLRVLLVVGPGVLSQNAPQSLLPLCGHLR